MTQIKLLFCMILMVTAVSANAQNKLGAPFFPPYAYFDIDGNLTGIWMSQLSPVLKKANIAFKPIHIPITRFYSSVATGKVELSAMPKGFPGMDRVLFSEKPFAHFDMRVFWLSDDQDITAMAELANKRVVLIKGYTYGGLLDDIPEDSREQFQVADDQRIALKLLMEDKADYVLGYWAMMSYLQKNYPTTQINNKKVAQLPIFFVVNAKTPNAEDLINRFNSALDTVTP